MQLTIDQIKAALTEAGAIAEADFDGAAAEAARRGIPVEDLIAEKNLVPDEFISQILAEKKGFPNIQLETVNIPDYILRAIPERVARKVGAVAFGRDEAGRLKLAMRDPDDIEFRHLMEKKTGVRIVPYYTTLAGIRYGLERYTKDLESAIKALIAEAGSRKKTAKIQGEEDSTIIRVVELLMNYAYQNSASDIHIEPHQQEIVIRYRIDGILHDAVTLSREYLDSITARIKVLSKLRTDEHLAAQDGKFQELINGERVDVRVSILPIVNGEKIVMRLLTEKGKKFNLQRIGFMDRDMKKLQHHINKSFGMILATGPTGSGKTTTLYAVLKILNTRDLNIATIEDPIEYAMEGVNQIQVNAKTGLTFAHGLRSIVRQDPDIIMVGEIRDEETAGISVNAAMTGHLVLSTLHTNDAATTLPRFRDMKVEPFLIASTINVIIAQRLVRRVCSRCVMSRSISLDELRHSFPDELIKKVVGKTQKKSGLHFFRGKGCAVCSHTGYQGRLGIFEILEMESNIRELVMQNANAQVITEQAVKNGMTTMLEDGLRKALNGDTTFEEVVRVIGN